MALDVVDKQVGAIDDVTEDLKSDMSVVIESLKNIKNILEAFKLKYGEQIENLDQQGNALFGTLDDFLSSE